MYHLCVWFCVSLFLSRGARAWDQVRAVRDGPLPLDAHGHGLQGGARAGRGLRRLGRHSAEHQPQGGPAGVAGAFRGDGAPRLAGQARGVPAGRRPRQARLLPAQHLHAAHRPARDHLPPGHQKRGGESGQVGAVGRVPGHRQPGHRARDPVDDRGDAEPGGHPAGARGPDAHHLHPRRGRRLAQRHRARPPEEYDVPRRDARKAQGGDGDHQHVQAGAQPAGRGALRAQASARAQEVGRGQRLRGDPRRVRAGGAGPPQGHG
mmetsp:Transcript_56805/g.128740  ORF Transcript_56805/g.128740 Transcript_56805/m.128740 type:complete len:263 (+) Transcript_56805:762-1550(+)